MSSLLFQESLNDFYSEHSKLTELRDLQTKEVRANTEAIARFLETKTAEQVEELKEVNTKLFHAVHDRQLDKLKETIKPYLESPETIRFLTSIPLFQGISLLGLACQYADFDIVSYLVDTLEVDVNHAGVDANLVPNFHPSLRGVFSASSYCIFAVLSSWKVKIERRAIMTEEANRMWGDRLWKILRFLAERGVDLNVVMIMKRGVSDKYQTVLAKVVEINDPTLIRYLVEDLGLSYHPLDFFEDITAWPRPIFKAIRWRRKDTAVFLVQALGSFYHGEVNSTIQDYRLLFTAIKSASNFCVEFKMQSRVIFDYVLDTLGVDIYFRAGAEHENSPLFEILRTMSVCNKEDIGYYMLTRLMDIHISNMRAGKFKIDDPRYFWFDWVSRIRAPPYYVNFYQYFLERRNFQKAEFVLDLSSDYLFVRTAFSEIKRDTDLEQGLYLKEAKMNAIRLLKKHQREKDLGKCRRLL